MRHELVVQVLVANAMRERVEAGAQRALRILERVDVRDRAQSLLVRLVDDGGVELRRQLLHRSHAVVNPELDDVDLLGGLFVDRRARLGDGRHPVRRHRASRLGTRDAATCGKETRRAGNLSCRCLCADLERHVGRVLPETLRRADTVVRTPRQIVDQHLARLAEMRVRVDDRRHHGLAGEVDSRRARGNAHVAGAADLREAVPAHDERGVLDRASVADDDARVFEYRYRIRRLRTHRQRQRRHRREHEQSESVHGILPDTRPSTDTSHKEHR